MTILLYSALSRETLHAIGAIVHALLQLQEINKKLRSRKEPSASVVLSWCTS